MATSLLRQFRSFPFTVLETGTTVLKRPVTSSYNCPYSRPLGTSLFSAWMVPEQMKITFDKIVVQQPPQSWTTTLPDILTITLLEFTQHFTMPLVQSPIGGARKSPILIVLLILLDPNMSSTVVSHLCNKCQVSELLAGHETYTEAYAEFLQAENIPSSLEEDIFRLQQLQATHDTKSVR